MYDTAYYRCYTREEKYICKVDRADAFGQHARGTKELRPFRCRALYLTMHRFV